MVRLLLFHGLSEASSYFVTQFVLRGEQNLFLMKTFDFRVYLDIKLINQISKVDLFDFRNELLENVELVLVEFGDASLHLLEKCFSQVI